MDLDVVMRSNDCQFIVKFYGALFKEVCCELIPSPHLWNQLLVSFCHPHFSLSTSSHLYVISLSLFLRGLPSVL